MFHLNRGQCFSSFIAFQSHGFDEKKCIIIHWEKAKFSLDSNGFRCVCVTETAIPGCNECVI